MLNKTSLIITSIADCNNKVLRLFAEKAQKYDFDFFVIGDAKSPTGFSIDGCRFFSLDNQLSLPFISSKLLPTGHYSRKNLGYLLAMQNKSNVIIETDDDNIPLENFWINRESEVDSICFEDAGWVNVYKMFSNVHIWPRGFELTKIMQPLPSSSYKKIVFSPIQQYLADENPDVDAIYRLTAQLPVTFNQHQSIALGNRSICPFNSQNTVWFSEAYPLLYLPSFCSFRMTDIWRSFVAQRISWACGWHITFHSSTVRQERNEHNLLRDFNDEISGYLLNSVIVDRLMELDLKNGFEHISENLLRCYRTLTEAGFFDKKELSLVDAWIEDVQMLGH